jgi:hypothetical protein
MRVRKIMYSTVFARLPRLGHPRERGGLERANELFNLSTCAWTDVAAFGKFIGNHILVSDRVLPQGGAIRRSGGSVNGPYAGIETFVQRVNKVGIFNK